MFILDVEYGETSDSLYVLLSDRVISRSVEVTEDFIVDLDERGVVVGLDFQHISETVFRLTSI